VERRDGSELERIRDGFHLACTEHREHAHAPNVQQLRYVRDVDAAERSKLVEKHIDISRRAAAVIYPRVKQHVEFEELVALANTGLAEAASRFDPTRGAAFTTFAWYRVQGAIIDGIRKATNLPRRTWAKLLALRAASEYLEHRGERDAGAVAKGIELPTGPDALAQVKQALAAIRTMYVTSLDTLRDEKGFDPGGETPQPGDAIDTKRFAGRLAGAIEKLPEKERELVKKHYWEGKNLLEAGAELGISKSWASRLHAQAVDRLRDLIDEDSG
jgi:RNA polymerase sigma factor for flagellar operon FliA